MNYLEELFVYTFIAIVVVGGVIIGLCNTEDAGHTGEENDDDKF